MKLSATPDLFSPKTRRTFRRAACSTSDLICLSHLRWDFVFQRPQHLLSRFGRHRRVYYVEEPEFGNSGPAWMHRSSRENGVTVLTPQLPWGLSASETNLVLKDLLDQSIDYHGISNFTLWYYTPMALNFSRHLSPDCLIYDCMDELSGFKNAPANIRELEDELFRRADFALTGGQSLYEAKFSKHPRLNVFPSSIDYNHFAQARIPGIEPADQNKVPPGPKIGFFGVLDERSDTDLIHAIAQMRPEYQYVFIGPTAKINPYDLPKASNIHYLGMKKYEELPSYIAHWDAAIMPFALNESTRYISPTKTPEYLAAGKPVVSTAIRDVCRPYGDLGLVHIASSPEEFVAHLDSVLNDNKEDRAWLVKVDEFLRRNSWDKTWRKIADLELKHSFEKAVPSSREMERSFGYV